MKIAAGSETAETTSCPALVQGSGADRPAEAALIKLLTQPAAAWPQGQPAS